MKGSFLLTRPNHDLTTTYLYYWAKAILNLAKAKNVLAIDLASAEVTKSNFISSVKKYYPSFIYFNGHGSLNTVTGFNNEPLIIFADNEEATDGRVVYALSCQSAKRLGKSCVSRGAQAYLGYDEDFIFLLDEACQNDPVNDQTAANFLRPSNSLASALLEGESTGEAFQNAQEEFNQVIIKYSLSEATAEERELLPYLVWDRDHQVCLGNKEARCDFLSEEEFKSKERWKMFVVGAVALFLLTAVLTFLLWK